MRHPQLANAVFVGGKHGNRIKLEERAGRLLWLIPPPDSNGAPIVALARKAAVPILDAVRMCMEFQKNNIIEEVQ